MRLSRISSLAIVLSFLTLPLCAQWLTQGTNSSGGSNMYNTNTGYVGVGASNPLTQFEVSSDTSPFFTLNTNGTCGACSPSFLFTIGNSQKAYIGIAGSANNPPIPGMVVGDMYIRGQNQKVVFSTDGGTSAALTLSLTGDATFKGAVTGTNITAQYQDVAEWVPALGVVSPGTVVVLDDTHANTVTACTQAYDTRVAGVVSAQPGVSLGRAGEGKAQVATTGRVRVRVDAGAAPIAIGDLLVTSARPGYAMKSIPADVGGMRLHRPGTLIGKALEAMPRGDGEILVLLSLQ